MATITKENEVLTAASGTAAPVTLPASARGDDCAARPQPVALEVPVTVNGARTVEGSDKREPFSETTRTVLIFGNGAVIRLGSPVSPGQLLFLTNEKTKKEVVCQVVKSKNYRNVSGYVELEFTESVLGFWGMRFPTDRIVPQASVSSATVTPASKDNSVAPLAVAPGNVSPVVSVSPKISEVLPAQIHAEFKPVASTAPRPTAPSASIAPPPELPEAKILEVPQIHTPEISSSVAFSVASLLSPPQPHPVLMPSTLASPLVPAESEQTAAKEAGANASEELKQRTSRLQEQLSSLLFSDDPVVKSVPSTPALDPTSGSDVATKLFEMAKSEPSASKAAPNAKATLSPTLSYLDTEEVKIPSWLEPLARNAAAPASTQELIEREKAKHAAEIAAAEEHPADPVPMAEVEKAPEVELPGIGNLLPLDEVASSTDRPAGGFRRGVWIGALAAVALAAAGAAWYVMQPTNPVQGTSAPLSSVPSTQSNASIPSPGATQPASQNSLATPEPTAPSNEAPLLSSPALGASPAKSPVAPQHVAVIRDNTRGGGTTIPADVTERVSRTSPAPAPNKPGLGEVRLARPKMNRPAASQDEEESAPTLANGAVVPNVGGLDSGLAEGGGKQPAAPEAPLPIGGDVQTARLISQVSPFYPVMARNQHVSGDVVIDALIDVSGRVTTMKIISGPALLHQAARDALRQWKYQPASLDGKPVPMHLTVTLQFRMQ
jgi:TonB family protein